MRVEKQVEPGLESRDDLIRIMDAAAEYLASRDKDADSEAHAKWRLWSAPSGEIWISLELQDQDFFFGRQFAPNLLVPADIRELRMINLWNDVLRVRARREITRVNELISQYQGE